MSRYGKVKAYFASEMYSITGESCSCDHTFKLAKRVGIMRNGQWIPQYDSLFNIQNEIGQVLYWQLTMGSAYSTVRDGLECLCKRMK